MAMAAELSARLGLIDAGARRRASRASSPPPACRCARPRSASTRYLELMRMDKKAEAGDLRFIVLAAPARPVCAVPTRRASRRPSRHSAATERGAGGDL